MSESLSEKLPAPGAESAEAETRRTDLLKAVSTSPNTMSIGMIADIEGGLILESAVASYGRGVDVAAIITSHASCERDLLIRASRSHELSESEPPKAYVMWGLGKLVDYFVSELPAELSAKLLLLNVRRKNLYHYGHSDSEIGIRDSTHKYIHQRGQPALYEEYERRHGQIPDQTELLEFATHAMLRKQALEAIESAFATRAWATR
jgi:hypothetical protein